MDQSLREHRGRCDPLKLEYSRRMRRAPTPAELALWLVLSSYSVRDDGIRFRRQVVLRGWIVDFFCHQLGRVIEVDGGYHSTPEARAYDAERERVLVRACGVHFVRLTNAEVLAGPGAAGERCAAR